MAAKEASALGQNQHIATLHCPQHSWKYTGGLISKADGRCLRPKP